MNIDYVEMPFEIWCDTLEDEGMTTEDVRSLFNQSNGYVNSCGVGSWAADGDGYLDGYGDGYEDGYGDGDGYGYGSAYGDGYRYGYEDEYAYGDGNEQAFEGTNDRWREHVI